jgi:DNA-binding NtrC family response regulator
LSALKFLRLCVEVCRALKPLHKRGLLHGDLKPGNVICSDGGDAHLIDFSFVRASGPDATRQGTVPYMSPEVIEGKDADARADLYSLGVTFFDIAAGHPPFEGTIGDIVSGHLGAARPELVFERIAERDETDRYILAGLRAVVGRMIRRQPDERFPDVYEVEAALAAIAPDLIADDPLLDLPILNESELRQVWLSKILGGLDERLSTGSGEAFWIVEGELGSGKSEILRAVKWWAQLDRVAVLDGKMGSSHMSPLPELAEQLADMLGGTDFRGPGDTSEELPRLARFLTNELSRLCREKRVLVLLDDIDQSSPEAQQVLRSLLATTPSDGKLAILASADVGFQASQRLFPGEQLRLPSLGAHDVIPLVEAFLGKGKAEPKLVERLLAHTGGSPLFVVTLLRDLASSSEPLETLERLGPPQQLEHYWRRRLGGLSGKKRCVLGAVAVFEKSATPADIREVTELEEKDVRTALQSLEAEGWIRSCGEAFQTTTKPLAREVLEELPVSERRTLHLRAMELESDDGKRLLHAAAAGLSRPLQAEGLGIARMLERSGALHAARELLEAIVGICHDESLVRQARLDLGRVCMLLGSYPEAEHELRLVVDAPEHSIQSKGLLLLGSLYGLRRELPAAVEALEKALAVGLEMGEQAACLRELANIEYRRGAYEKARSFALQGLELVPQGHSVLAQLHDVLAKVDSAIGRHDQALAHAHSAVESARHGTEQRAVAMALDTLAWARQQAGDLVGAAGDLEQASSIYRQVGDLARLLRNEIALGALKLWLESWHEALEHFEGASRLAGAVANPSRIVDVRANLGLALAKVGRFERAALVLQRAEAEAKRVGQSDLLLMVRSYVASLELARGNVEESIRTYSEVRTGYEASGQGDLVAETEIEMAGALLWRGGRPDLEEALRLIARAGARPRALSGRMFEQRCNLYLGAARALGGEMEKALPLLEELTQGADQLGRRDLAWQAHLALARAHRGRQSDFLARRHLREAERILEQLSTGLSAEHRQAFWQDVRRAEVRALLATIPSSSGGGSSLVNESAGAGRTAMDPEAEALYRVLDFNKQLSSEHELPRLLDGILDAAVELTKAERGLLLWAEKEGLEVQAARGIGGDAVHQKFSRSIAESVFLDGEPVSTVDAASDYRFKEFLSIHELQLRSVACVPVSYKGKVLGVLYLENRFREGRFAHREMRVLSAFADQVAIAVSQAQLIEEARRRSCQLEEAKEALAQAYSKQAAALDTRTADLKNTRERLARLKERVVGQGDYHGVIGTGPVMQRIFSLMDRVRDLDVPVVFVGGIGSGKDLLARVMHDVSARRRGPFVAVSCGGIPDTLVESVLFGHVKGAFSGAADDSPGLLRTAVGGTLYLDDIEGMSPRMQVSFLRVLQEGCFTPLGSAAQIQASFRLVISSKVPLSELVAMGVLREDLRYRLEVIVIQLPDLKDRAEDVPVLARRFLERECEALGRPLRLLSTEALEALVSHPWPGNVRQLEQTLRRAMVLGESGGPVTAQELLGQPIPTQARGRKRDALRVVELEADEDERRHIVAALTKCKWNRTLAAQELGMPRRTFYRRLEKYGLLGSE